MSKTASRPDTAGPDATSLRAALIGGIGSRLLLLLVLAEAPLVVFMVGLVLQNEHLQAASSLGAAGSAQNFALRMGELTALFIAEFILIAGGVNFAVSRPLQRLNVAIDHWRDHGSFVTPNAGDPTELVELARSFAQATVSLNQREAELRSSITRQEALMQEIHHRVKNNLQIVASLLNLQSSRIRVPEARAEFQSARDRVRTLATLHRYLYADGELQMMHMGAFFTELCSQMFQAVDEVEGDRIDLVVHAPDLTISSDQAVPIALVVTETVGNSLRYAYPDGRRGRICVNMDQQGDTLCLTIADDGIGFDQSPGAARDSGLGLQLIRGFARQLGARLEVTSNAGTCYRLDMQLAHQRVEARLAAGPSETLVKA